jgi:hypothetical protein
MVIGAYAVLTSRGESRAYYIGDCRMMCLAPLCSISGLLAGLHAATYLREYSDHRRPANAGCAAGPG